MKPDSKHLAELKELSDEVFLVLFGYRDQKQVEGRGLCGLMPQVFTWGLCYGIDRQENYEGRYCFHTLLEARDSLKTWDGKNDPPGNWVKHKGTLAGEYRNPNYERNEL